MNNHVFFRSRRDFVSSGLATAIAQFLNCAPAFRAVAQPLKATDHLASACARLKCVDPISQACGRALALDNDSALAVASALRVDLAAAGLDCSSASTLLRSLRERSRQDFEAGNIMCVDDWILSRTETHVYALAAYIA